MQNPAQWLGHPRNPAVIQEVIQLVMTQHGLIFRTGKTHGNAVDSDAPGSTDLMAVSNQIAVLMAWTCEGTTFVTLATTSVPALLQIGKALWCIGMGQNSGCKVLSIQADVLESSRGWRLASLTIKP